jgi:hypothetical protein
MWMIVNLEGMASMTLPPPPPPTTTTTTTVTDIARNTPTIPAECTGNKRTVCFTHSGYVYDKSCKFVKRVKDQVCNLPDHKTGDFVKDKCARSCTGG